MKRSAAGGLAFVAVGIAFLVLGSSGSRAFLPIGMAFAAIGILFVARGRRPKPPA